MLQCIDKSLDSDLCKNISSDLRLRVFVPCPQDKILDTLNSKVEEVYHCCVGETEANLTILQMLTAIEEKLGQLLENAEMIPKDQLSIAERAKEKERRMR